ncbi:MAG: hypothetical protein Q7S33_05045 [Nanoarchaeota archaeon]|nr:hypothetical protein [Nanoarchaeota archaeon]
MADSAKQFKKINAQARSKTNARGKKEQEELNKKTKQQELI